jgi:hypothetical protein
MDWQPEKPDGDPDFLDRLLAEAKWAEPTPAAIERLRGHWRSLVIRRTRRRRLAWMLMAASILLVAVGLTSWLRSGPGADRRTATDIAGKNVAPSPPQPVRQPVPRPKPQPDSLLVKKRIPARAPVARSSRPPNAYERVLLIAHRRTHADRMQPVEPPPVEPTVEQAAEEPAGDQQDAALRRELLSLLAQNDLQSVRAFLQRVEDQHTSTIALDCLAATPNPPVELLFRCVHSPAAAQRTAAALALGRLNQPAISRELITMIARGVHRQEALIALFSSSEAAARAYVADAERSQMLAATFWNAKRQLQNFFPWRS